MKLCLLWVQGFSPPPLEIVVQHLMLQLIDLVSRIYGCTYICIVYNQIYHNAACVFISTLIRPLTQTTRHVCTLN